MLPADDNPGPADFVVVMNGRPLAVDVASQVQSLDVEHSVELPGRIALVLEATGYLDIDGGWFAGDEPFAVGGAIEVSGGYLGSKLQPIMAGEITAIDAQLVADQPPLLTVRGYDARHRLQRGRRTRTFSKMKDSQIASRIAQEAGLAAEVSDSRVVHDYLIQANQTDLEFLLDRARRIGYELLMHGRTLRFRPLGHLAGPSLSLSIARGNLIEFRVQLSSTGQATEASVRGWDVKRKQSIVSIAQRGEVAAMGTTGGPAMALRAFGKAPQPLVTQPVASVAEAEQMAQAALATLALPLVRGEGLCYGVPELQAGIVVQVTDGGARFDGNYYVASAQHRWDTELGYTTRFSAWRNAT